MKFLATPPTEAQVSRWVASALVTSSILLGTAVVLAQSPGAGDPAKSLSEPTHPASPTAPPAFTPETRPQSDPRSAGEIAMDATVAERVKRALSEDHLTRSEPIAIEVTRGIANLSGAVKSRGVAERALSIARSTGGVSAVQDAMKVDGEEAARVVR